MADQPQQKGSSAALEREEEADADADADADPSKSAIVPEEHPAQPCPSPSVDMPAPPKDMATEEHPVQPSLPSPEDKPTVDSMVTEDRLAQPGSPPPPEDKQTLENITTEEPPAPPTPPAPPGPPAPPAPPDPPSPPAPSMHKEMPAHEDMVMEQQPVPLVVAMPQTKKIKDMLACVDALDNALLRCLPAQELSFDHGFNHLPDHRVLDDVERCTRGFIETAKKLQRFFIGLQQTGKPSQKDILEKEITVMEEEQKMKAELIKKYEEQIAMWRKELKERLEEHEAALKTV